MTNFSGLLTSYIKQSGLSLRKVASEAGIPFQTLYNWMKGKHPRWYAALPDDLHRLGVSLQLSNAEIEHLQRLGCGSTLRLGLFKTGEVSMSNALHIPKGWTFGGDAPQKYEMGLDPEVTYGELPCLTIKSLPNPTDFGALLQTFKADTFQGQRLRFSAMVRSVGVENIAALWMRVGGANNAMLAFDNMSNRPIAGTTGWTNYSVVLDVAPEAETVGFGFFLSMGGQVWMSDIHLEVVGKEVPTTDMIEDILQELPTNLDLKE